MRKLITCLVLSALLYTTVHSPSSPNFVSMGPVQEMPPVPIWAGVDWNNPTEIAQYVRSTYGRLGNFLNEVITKESGYNIHACNGNFVGLMQMGPAASRAVGYRYQDVKKYPWINLEAGTAYIKTYCLPNANGDLQEAYKRYNLGPWYDKILPDSL